VARHEAGLLTGLRDRAAAAGLAIEELSVGAAPTLRFSAAEPGLTELRPGNYVYFDRTQVGLGSAALADCALTVLATVVSRPAVDRLILDCGSKTLSSDRGSRYGGRDLDGYGVVLTADGSAIDGALTIARLSEEHATVRITAASSLQPGDRVRVLPNHSCVVSNLVDEIRLVEDDRVIETLSVAARGKIT